MTAIKASDIPFNEGLLRLCAVHNKTVTFRYQKQGSNTIEQRRLVPSKVDTNPKDGSLRFTGFDPDRNQVRAYRVDRMLGEVSVA